MIRLHEPANVKQENAVSEEEIARCGVWLGEIVADDGLFDVMRIFLMGKPTLALCHRVSENEIAPMFLQITPGIRDLMTDEMGRKPSHDGGQHVN